MSDLHQIKQESNDPDASIEAYQAERFGEQLVEAARRAKDIPKA